MTGGAHTTPRDVNSVVLGGTGGTSVGDKLILNGGTITVGGAGAQSDVVNHPADGAVHLGHAAETVGILHAGVVLAVGLANL